MSSFEREFSTAVQSAERSALIDLIRSRPSMSLAELGKLGKGRFAGLFSGVTVGDLLGGSARSAAPSRAAAPRGRRARGGGGVDTRTPAARGQYDEACLRIVKAAGGKPVSAQDVRSQIGGTPLQARKALNRLIERGKLKYKGKARATKYFPA